MQHKKWQKKAFFSAKKAKNQARKKISDLFFCLYCWANPRSWTEKKSQGMNTFALKFFVSDPRETQIVLQSWSVPYIIILMIWYYQKIRIIDIITMLRLDSNKAQAPDLTCWTLPYCKTQPRPKLNFTGIYKSLYG